MPYTKAQKRAIYKYRTTEKGKLSVKLANKNYYLKRRQTINKTLVDFSKNQATLG